MPKANLRPLSFRTLREDIAQSLRVAIMDGRLRPGQRIMHAEIASQMGVSRSPVQEAIRQLEKDGLVRATSNRGTFVMDLSQEDLVSLYGIRAVLEGLAAAWACQHITESQLEQLRQLSRQMQKLLPLGSEEARISFLHLDGEFHSLLLASAGAPRLSEALAGIGLQIRVIMAAISIVGRGSAQAGAEHEAMLDAIASQEPELAERLARGHVEGARERMLRAWADGGGG